MVSRRPILVGAALAACGVAPLARSAEPYPSRPIRLIVPYPPGGGIDPTARLFAQALSEELGKPIVVLNVGGASGQIGTDQAAKSAPDGYTLLFASAAPNAILPAVLPKLPYRNQDLSPISLVGSAAYVLVTHPSVAGTNVQQLLQSIRAKPDFIPAFASSGQLSGPHLAGELFKVLSKAEMTHIPYRGNGPALTAVLANEVPMMFASAPAVMQHVKEGRLKIYGISARQRSPSIPDVPALGELMPGLEVTQWYGLMAPAATPPEIVAQLHRSSLKVMGSPAMKSQLAIHGVEPRTNSPAQFAAFVESETKKYRELVERAHITSE